MIDEGPARDSPDSDADQMALRRVCAILQPVCQRYPADSAEAVAIRDAAAAYVMVNQHQRLRSAFDKLRQALGGKLTDALRSDLLRHGIDPQDYEDLP